MGTTACNRLNIAYLWVYTAVGYGLLAVQLLHVSFSEWPEILILSFLLSCVILSSLPIPRHRATLAVVSPILVLGILMLKARFALVCVVVVGAAILRSGRSKHSLALLKRHWAAVRLVPVILAANTFYARLGGGGFDKLSEVSWPAFAVLVLAVSFLDWWSFNLQVALQEGKPPWKVAVPLVSMFDLPASILALPLYLAYRANGPLTLLLFSLPLVAAMWVARFLFQESFKKQESIEFLEVANEVIGSSLNLAEMIERVSVRVKELVNADGVEVYFMEGNGLERKYGTGHTPWKGRNPPRAFLHALARKLRKHPTAIPQTGEEMWLSEFASSGIGSLLLIPLVAEGNVVGCLLCTKESPFYFYCDHVEGSRYLYLSAQVSGALLSSKLHEELRVAHEELRATQELLVSSEKMASLGRLAAGVAHEINNPLGAILLNGEIVLNDRQDTEAVLSVIEAAKRCKAIVEQLLFFSHQTRVDAGPFDLENVVDHSLRLLRPQLKQEGIDLHVDVSGSPRLRGNSGGLGQVLMNLIANARDAITAFRKDGGLIRIQVSDAPDQAMLRVADNGCGIDEAVFTKIFEPFYTTKGVGRGTGLGLWVSYGIVSSMGGKIEVKSRLGEGTTFTLTFPKSIERAPSSSGDALGREG